MYLKDVVTLVLENRPEDPVAFVADYLRRVLSGASPLSRAYQYLTLSPHYRRAFVDNATVAFSVLDAGPRGLTGADHAELLRARSSPTRPETCRGPPQTRSPRDWTPPSISSNFSPAHARASPSANSSSSSTTHSEARRRAAKVRRQLPRRRLPERDSRGTRCVAFSSRTGNTHPRGTSRERWRSKRSKRFRRREARVTRWRRRSFEPRERAATRVGDCLRGRRGSGGGGVGDV